MGEENVSRKRDREDSAELDSNHQEPKRVNSASSFQSDVWKPSSPGSSGTGDEIDEVENFGINNGIPEDILDTLDDGDTMPENQDLDSVIRSFEEEILQSSPSSSTKPSEIMELRSDPGEYQLDLGYLLEASDDELGLPPTDSSSAEEQHPQQDPIDDPFSRKSSEVTDLGDMFTFENELPRYDSLGFDLGEMAGGEVNNSNGGFGTVVDDGLFEYSEPSDPADLSWLCGCM